MLTTAEGGRKVPRIAINGLGRIGRAALKVISEIEELDLVAVNDVVSPENLAYLLKYDTVYGRYPKDVQASDDALVIDGGRIPVFAEPDPARLPWGELSVDLVLECTGKFRTEEGLTKHIEAGARFAILSAPAKTETIATVVHGANQAPQGQHIISCASCTTNSVAPVVEVMSRRIGIERAIMTTVHAYTASQRVVDGPSADFRRGRAGAANLVPSSTGAAAATSRALPALGDRFDGIAIRVPIPVGSISDVVFVTSRPTSPEEINDIFREEAGTDRYRRVLGVAEDPIVSSDIVGDPRASVIDAGMTRVVDGTLAKVVSWYDNEWGFAHQMVREALAMLGIEREI
jgi:glyceraldehyde 3-phosphate dehydrogenase